MTNRIQDYCPDAWASYVRDQEFSQKYGHLPMPDCFPKSLLPTPTPDDLPPELAALARFYDEDVCRALVADIIARSNAARDQA